MFFKNRCHITAVLVAGVLGISMVTGLTACGSSDGTRVVFTTGFGKNEVFRIGDEKIQSVMDERFTRARLMRLKCKFLRSEVCNAR